MCPKPHSPIKSVSSHYCPDNILFRIKPSTLPGLSKQSSAHSSFLVLLQFEPLWVYIVWQPRLLKINGFQMPFKSLFSPHQFSLIYCTNIELEIVSKEVFGLLMNTDSYLLGWGLLCSLPGKDRQVSIAGAGGSTEHMFLAAGPGDSKFRANHEVILNLRSLANPRRCVLI